MAHKTQNIYYLTIYRKRLQSPACFQIEMKYNAYKLGFKLVEVPIIFEDRKEGTSKMSSGIFGEAFWGVLKLRFRKIRPRR